MEGSAEGAPEGSVGGQKSHRKMGGRRRRWPEKLAGRDEVAGDEPVIRGSEKKNLHRGQWVHRAVTTVSEMSLPSSRYHVEQQYTETIRQKPCV